MTSSVLVTGASSGLGLATSASLAAAGHHVVLGSRSADRGAAAAAHVLEASPGASVEVLDLDLASFASVRSAAAALASQPERRPPLRAVICNAGIQVVDGVRHTDDGFELTFATNHLGHFLLTSLLVDHIVAPGRIVVVASGVHRGPLWSMGFPAPRWDDPRSLADADRAAEDTSGRAGRARYATSKLANLYMTYELARHLADRGVTVNAFDPGLMPETQLHRNYPPAVRRIYDRLTPLLIRAMPGARSVANSAANLAWLATAPELAGVTGAYFVGRRRRRSSKESYDQARAADLWAASVELTASAVEPGVPASG